MSTDTLEQYCSCIGVRGIAIYDNGRHVCTACHKLTKRGESVDGQPRIDGKKFDEGKPELGLVPKSLIWAVGTILTFGAKKYGHHNWRKGLAWSRAYNALLRHLTAWWDGENLDQETGKSHLHHAACELAFLIEYEAKGTGEDDRFTGK